MENIIGHEKVKVLLNQLIEEDKIGHAYMFVGKDGIGKKEIAIEFAKKIMSKDSNLFNEPDFKMIMPENELIKVEEIRDLINEVYIKPVYSNKKLIIIDDADKMNANAQNALLKVLEEPPAYITIILIVSNKERIIRTILSRVTEIAFDNLTNEELQKIIGREFDYDLARGSASKALSLLDGNYYEMANVLIQLIEKKDYLLLNRKFTEFKQLNVDILNVLETLKVMFYKNLKENTCEKIKMIEFIDNTIKNIDRNANVDLALDKFMIETCLE